MRSRLASTAQMTLVVALAASIGLSSSAANGATSGTVVGATVPSATTLTPGGCATGTSDVTDFGSLLPGVQVRTGTDCVVQFGSSNDTARLRLAQQDGAGSAMFRPTRGAAWNAFGTAGTYTTTFGGNDSLVGQLAFDAADQSFVGVTVHDNWSLVRLDADTGAYDASFGTAGVASMDPGPFYDQIADLAIQPDRSIVVVGRVDDCPVGVVNGLTHDCLAVGRFLPDGTPDPSFGGGDGLTLIDLVDGDSDQLNGVAITPSGAIVAVGTTTAWSGADALIVRFTSSGALDTTFGTGGYTHWPLGQVFSQVIDVTLGPDGSIYAAGRDIPSGNWDFLALKATANGAPVNAFGGDGMQTWDFGATDGEGAYSIGIDSTGRLVLAGYCGSSGFGDTGALVSNATTGALVTSFAGDGLECFELGGGSPVVNPRMTLGADDGVYLSAYIGDEWAACAPCRPVLARVSPTSGALDSSFDGDGLLVLGGAGTKDRVGVPAFGADGRLFVPGWRDDGGATEALVWAYDSTRVTDYGDPGGDWAAGGDVFGACMEATANLTSQAWVSHANCVIGDVAGRWHPIEDSTALPASQLATTATTIETGRVELRFGFETASSQPPGRYVAPLVFEVTAP